MKGIVLAGGSGSRLWPMTDAISKHLLPIYDKPMIFYPLSVLMLADVRDICIMTSKEYLEMFQRLFGDGSQLGLTLSYGIQARPEGVADAIISAENFIKTERFCLILGDNFFYGPEFGRKLAAAKANTAGATIFGYRVNDPSQFGIIEFSEHGKPLKIVEKPISSGPNTAVTGLYFFDEDAIRFAKNARPSARGELEIASVLSQYLEQGSLSIDLLGRGFAWLDAGTPSSLLEAAQFVETLEKRQGYKIACLEEIALKKGWINTDQLVLAISKIRNIEYKSYLTSLLST